MNLKVRREGEAIVLFTNLIKLKLLLKKVMEMLLRKKKLLMIVEAKGQREAHLKARATARVSSRKRGNVVVINLMKMKLLLKKVVGIKTVKIVFLTQHRIYNINSDRKLES